MTTTPDFSKSFFEIHHPEIELLFLIRKDIEKKSQVQKYKSVPKSLREIVIMVKLLGEIQRLEMYNTPLSDLLKKNEKDLLRHRIIMLLYLNIDAIYFNEAMRVNSSDLEKPEIPNPDQFKFPF